MKNKLNGRKMLFVVIFTMVMGSMMLLLKGNIVQAATKLKVTAKKTVAVNCTTTIKTNMPAKFKSSNKKIATVSSKGVVKGHKAGRVKITIVSKKNKNQKKTVTIVVNNQLVITNPQNAKATLEIGETLNIKANVSAQFRSKNTSIAKVSKNGTITARKAGSVDIVVTAKTNHKLKKTVKVKVKDKATETIAEDKTEKTTEVTTEERTEQPTEATTEKRTEQPTEATTEVTTEKRTEQTTEATTEKRTEQTTEATTEKRTEQTTEQTTTEEKTELSKSTVITSSNEEKVVVSGNTVYADADITKQEVLELLECEAGATISDVEDSNILVTAEDTSVTQNYRLTFITRKEAPDITIQYPEGNTTEIITDAMEYTFEADGFTGNAVILSGANTTVSVESGNQMWVRYKRGDDVFAPKEKKITIERMTLESVKYYPYDSAKNVNYDFSNYNTDYTLEVYLTNTEVEDFSTIATADIRSYKKSSNVEYLVDTEYYTYVYVRYAGTDTALASNWIKATLRKVDNVFDFDDIP